MPPFDVARGALPHLNRIYLASGKEIPAALQPVLPADATVLSAGEPSPDAMILSDSVAPVTLRASGSPFLWYLIRSKIFASFRHTGLQVVSFQALEDTDYLLAVPAAYSAAAHARALWKVGRTEAALTLLLTFAEAWGDDPETQQDIARTGQELRLEALERAATSRERLHHFVFGQIHFFRNVYVDPAQEVPYTLQAQAWRALERSDCGNALLRSHAFVFGDAAQKAQVESFSEVSIPAASKLPNPYPPVRRVLLWGIPGYDPMMDALYDGFVQLLSADAVDTWPYKPALHNPGAAAADDYPLTFEHPGSQLTVEEVCDRLHTGYYDLLLYGDVIGQTPDTERTRIVAAGANTPTVIVDGWDDAGDHSETLRARIGATDAVAVFKREMIRGVPYGDNTVPLTLPYADAYVPRDPCPERSRALFWAGNRYYGTRRLHLTWIEAALGSPLTEKFTQAEYSAALGSSLAGLSLCGFGYDTIRYHEVPAHAVCLIAERPPIHIPNDYRDGREVLLFSDTQELSEKLAWCLQNPHDALKIALAGRDHFLQFHTASRRAAQLLAHLGTYGVSA
jgi:hypothetical protein